MRYADALLGCGRGMCARKPGPAILTAVNGLTLALSLSFALSHAAQEAVKGRYRDALRVGQESWGAQVPAQCGGPKTARAKDRAKDG